MSLYEHEVDLKNSCSMAILPTEKIQRGTGYYCLHVFETTHALLSHSCTTPTLPADDSVAISNFKVVSFNL